MKNMAAAIDFGTSKIVTIIAQSGRYLRCDIIGAGLVLYDGYQEGSWNVPEQVDERIEMSVREAEKQAGQSIRDIYVGVPGEFSRVYVTETTLPLQGVEPQVTPEDVDRIFHMANQEIQPVPGVIIHRSPAWFMVDDGNKIMEPVGVKGSTLKTLVSFIVADQFFLDDMTKRLAGLGFNVAGFFSSPMGEAIQFLPPEDRDRTAVLIDIGYLNTEIMAVEGDALVFHKVLPVGGGDITKDLVYGLQVRMSVAEDIKRSYVFGMPGGGNIEVTGQGGKALSYTREEVSNILEPRVDEIAELIREALDHSGVRLGSWSNIYLTGGGLALMRGGREYLSAQMERPIRAPQPRGATLNSPIYASALGLIDLVFDSIDKEEERSGFFDKIKSLLRR